MANHHRHGELSGKVDNYPKTYVDEENDFLSIKLKEGIEAKSYEQDGMIICENESGEVIEIQILNVSHFKGKVA